MNTRSIIAYLLFLLILLTLILWLFAAQLLTLLIPPLVNDETLHIDRLRISSVGWRRAHVARVSGTLRLQSGRARFDVGDAVIDYDPYQRLLGRVDIRTADIEYAPSEAPAAKTAAESRLVFPPDVTIQSVSYSTRGSPGRFAGRFEMTGSGPRFSALAYDDTIRITADGDAAFTDFRVVAQRPDRTRMADADLHFDDTGAVDFEVDLALSPILDWLQQTQLLSPDYQETVDQIESVSGRVQGKGRFDDGDWAVRMDADIGSIKAVSFYGSAAVEGDLTVGEGQWQFKCTRSGTVSIHVPGYQLDGVSSVEWDLPTDYAVVQKPGESGSLVGRGTAGMKFQQTDDVRLHMNVVDWEVSELREIDVAAEMLELLSPYRLSAHSAGAKVLLVHGSPAVLEGDIRISGLRTDGWPGEKPGLTVSGNWTWNDGHFDIRGDAALNAGTTAKWTAASGRSSGSLKVELDASVRDALKSLQGFLGGRSQDMEFTDGGVRARLDWGWDDDRYHNRLELAATGVSGRVIGLEFEDASAQVNSSDLVAPSAQFESTASRIRLANDVDVTDLSIAGRWQNGVYIDQADMSALGGTISIKPAFFDPHGTSQRLELEVHDVDLAKIFGMLGQQALVGSGMMSGVIPLRRTEVGVAVDGGNLHNTTKGAISYHPGEEQNPQLDNIAFKALKDFRFDVLDANLDYNPNGDYAIRARLEGRNPDLYDGYPIAFNINLTGSLPGLLRASLITGDFHGEIIKQIKQTN